MIHGYIVRAVVLDSERDVGKLKVLEFASKGAADRDPRKRHAVMHLSKFRWLNGVMRGFFKSYLRFSINQSVPFEDAVSFLGLHDNKELLELCASADSHQYLVIGLFSVNEPDAPCITLWSIASASGHCWQDDALEYLHRFLRLLLPFEAHRI